jgi:hypothetical protein
MRTAFVIFLIFMLRYLKLDSFEGATFFTFFGNLSMFLGLLIASGQDMKELFKS